MKLLFKTKVPGHYDRVFSLFNLDLFEALKPPGMGLVVERFDGSEVGDEIHLLVGLGPIKNKWVSVITEQEKTSEQNVFVDEGKILPWPLKDWRHQHKVVKISEDESEIVDEIDYSTRNKILDRLIYPFLYAQFSLRDRAYKKFFYLL